MDVVEKYNNNGRDYLFALYKSFTSSATAAIRDSNKTAESTVRKEIKEHLRKNPEAIQVKNIARRNQSRQ
jgi:hypothetical protein